MMIALKDARQKAIEESAEHECVQHVNACVALAADGEQYLVTGYVVSDWEDGSTVESYSCGRRV